MKKYLEFKDEKSHKFWEIEVSGNSHEVRYGKIGSKGRKSIKNFDSEDDAKKDAEKLINAKKKKGYLEISANKTENKVTKVDNKDTKIKNKDTKVLKKGDITSCVYYTLNEDEIALFNDEYLKIDSFRIKLWDNKIKPVLRDSLYSGKYRMKKASRKNLAPFFERFAAKETLNMQHVVSRGKDNIIDEIKYSINGHHVLTIRNQSDEHDAKILPFWEKEYYYGSKENMEDGGVEKFLVTFPRFCVEIFSQFEKKEDEHKKEEKIKEVSLNNIDMVVKTLLKGSGHYYNIDVRQKNCILRIKLDEEKHIEMSLPYKTFVKRIEHIVPTINDIKEKFKELEIPVLLGNNKSRTKWGEVDTEELELADEDNFKIVFWEPKVEKFMNDTLFSGKNKKVERFNLKEIAKIDSAKLRKEVDMDGDNVDRIEYYLDDELVFEILSYGVECEFFDSDFITLNEDANTSPNISDWKKFIDRFPDFYLPLLKEKEKKEKEESKHIKDFENIWKKLKNIMKDENYEYALDYYDENYYYHLAQVKVKMQSKKVLHLDLHFREVLDKLPKIIPSIKLIEQMQENKIDFKIEENEWWETEWEKA